MAESDVRVVNISDRAKQTLMDFGWATEATLSKLATSNQLSTKLLTAIAKELKVSDQTLDKIVQETTAASKNVKRAAEILTTGMGDITRDASADIDAAINDIGRMGQETEKEITKTVKETSWAFKQVQRSITGIFTGPEGQQFHATMVDVGDSVKEWGKSFDSSMSPVLKKFTIAFGAVTSVVGTALQRLNDMNDLMRQLYTAGIAPQGGFEALATTAMATGVTMQNLAKIMTSFSGVVAVLGTKRLGDMSKQFAETTRLGADFLMSQEEAQEALMETMEQLRLSGELATMTNDQIVSRGTRTVAMFNDLALATGKNRDELRKATTALMNTTRGFGLMRAAGKGSSESISKFMAKISAEFGSSAGNIAEMVEGMFMGGAAGVNDAMRPLLAIVPGFGQQLEQITKDIDAGMDPSEASERISDVIEGIDEGVLRTLRFANPALYDTVREMQKNAQQARIAREQNNALSAEQKKANQEEIESAKARQAAFNSMNQTMTGLRTGFNTLLAKAVEPLTPVILKVTDAINKFTNSLAAGDWNSTIENVTDALLGLGKVAGFLASAVASVISGFKKVADWGEQLTGIDSGKILAGLVAGGFFAALIAKSAFKAAAARLGSQMIGSIGGRGAPAADATGKAVGGIGKGIGAGLAGISEGAGKAISSLAGGIGEGLAKLLPAVGKGIAGFFEAFGNPGVLKGATIAGAAIGIFVGLVGAGTAVAIAAIGLSLKAFAWGLKDLVDIDPDKLKQLGEGLKELGSGMMSFALATGANVVATITNAIAGIFGGDFVSRIQKTTDGLYPLLPKFKEIGPALNQFFSAVDAKKIEEFSNSMEVLGKGMSSFAMAVGKGVMASIADSFAGFFGADIGSKLKKLIEQLTPILPQLLDLGPALQRYGDGIKSFADSFNAINVDQMARVIPLLRTLTGVDLSNLRNISQIVGMQPTAAAGDQNQANTFKQIFDNFIKKLSETVDGFSIKISEIFDNNVKTLQETFGNFTQGFSETINSLGAALQSSTAEIGQQIGFEASNAILNTVATFESILLEQSTVIGDRIGLAATIPILDAARSFESILLEQSTVIGDRIGLAASQPIVTSVESYTHALKITLDNHVKKLSLLAEIFGYRQWDRLFRQEDTMMNEPYMGSGISDVADEILGISKPIDELLEELRNTVIDRTMLPMTLQPIAPINNDIDIAAPVNPNATRLNQAAVNASGPRIAAADTGPAIPFVARGESALEAPQPADPQVLNQNEQLISANNNMMQRLDRLIEAATKQIAEQQMLREELNLGLRGVRSAVEENSPTL